jgi:hypothetical protein
VAEILRSSNLRGTGTVVFPAVDRDTLVQTAHIELTVKDWLKEPSAGSAAAHPAINLPAYILTNMGSYAQDSREFGYACNAVHLKEMFDVQYDPQFKLSRLPTDTKLGIDGISFTASYQFADNRLRGERELVISQSYQYCSPQEYERRKNVMRQIVRHLRAPLLYAQE